ncbi:lipocalin-like domain-containing protein [Rhizobium sp. TH2]|uniref:lipocalin-like domain-containing protein n=1 Tax=Rhizobium sp. TH2 TaxID=2775403 RepID=UPI00215878F0|nr:lipocalin-like domain-containing protein [Rhizobium sp. TH2]UVC11456.1 lipocalin-like domain-containing protein [Rhizobium sp. TH2]
MQAGDLIGVWMIRSFIMHDVETGEQFEPWGERPGGTLVLSDSGRMFAIITADGREPPSTDAEQAHAYRNMLSYTGPYRIDPPNELVTTVDIAWHAPWIGTEQRRYCEMQGETLVLTSAPLAMPGKDGQARHVLAVVEWTREA